MGDYESPISSPSLVDTTETWPSDARLSPNIIPHHYQLSLYDIDFQAPWNYKGRVVIGAKSLGSCERIIVNAKEMVIENARVVPDDGKEIWIQSIEYSKIEETACLQLSSAIVAGNFVIDLEFQGTINQSMSGFFRTKYRWNPVDDESEERHMLVTQFEPCAARKAFPCFDDPALKATFELTVEVSEQLCVLSNMPTVTVSTRDGTHGALKKHQFEKTPVMSTYLLAWAIGDFEYIEAFTERKHCGKHVPVRVYTTPGLTQYGHFALAMACKVLDFFAEVFDIDYPLAKSDHLVANDFIVGAMENWALCVYKPTKILFEPGACDNRLNNKAAYVVAHELAHQWFGNLVTMKDWSQLWLNEGFATWAAYLAMDHILPDWRPWAQFNVEVMEEAFTLDGVAATHPVETKIDDPLAALQAFDNISYFKGASVIRMLCSHIGSKAFFSGVSAYLKTFAYGNASSKNLWDALSDTSGLDVSALMDAWIHKPGYPILEVQKDNSSCTLTQLPYLTSGDCKAGWTIPLLPSQTTCRSHETLQDKTRTLNSGVPKLFNEGHTGFYRTCYPHGYIQSNLQLSLSAEDKAGLVADLFALCLSGHKTLGEFLDLVSSLREEDDCFVWQQISASVGTLRSIFASRADISMGLSFFLSDVLADIICKVGWNVENGTYLEVERSKILLSLAESVDHKAIVEEMLERFSCWRKGGNLDGNLLLLVFSCAIGRGTKADFDSVKQHYLRTMTIDGKELCLRAMGRISDPMLVEDLVRFATSDAVPLQNANLVAAALAKNPFCREHLWVFMKEQWDTIHAKLSENETALSLWIEEALSQFSDVTIIEDIKSFFADKDSRVFAKSLSISYDKIERSSRFKIRESEALLKWLQVNGYSVPLPASS